MGAHVYQNLMERNNLYVAEARIRCVNNAHSFQHGLL